VPEDTTVREFDLDGKPTVALSDENRALKAAYHIFEKRLHL
jgi:hypothetical protein